MAQYVVQMEDKITSEELEHYVKHADLLDLANLLKSVPAEKRDLIPDILPEILADSALTMPEKVGRLNERLTEGRSRVSSEQSQADEEARQRDLAANALSVTEVMVRDIGTGPDGRCRRAEAGASEERWEAGLALDGVRWAGKRVMIHS